MMDSQKFCLKWDGFQSSVTSVFDHLRRDEELVDITLCCEGHQVRAHRMMLSACSPYFRDLLKNNPCQQMVFFLKDTSADDLRAIIEFMYKGSVNVAQTQLASFIKTAELLQIRGLSGDDDKMPSSPVPASQQSSSVRPTGPDPRPPAASTPLRPQRNGTPPPKRRRPSETSDPAARPPPIPPLPPLPPQQPLPQPTQQQPSSPPPSSNASAMEPSASLHGPTLSQPSPARPVPSLLPGGDTAAPAEEQIKIEKVDLTEDDDDDGTLDSTLGYVAEYEGGYGEGQDLSGAALMDAAAGVGGGVAGPSQRAADDGSQSDQIRFVCNICGKVYKYRESLTHHKKKHEGLTTCFVCGKVCCIVAELRRHLELAHGLTQEEVRRIVPTKPKERMVLPPFQTPGHMRPPMARAAGASPVAMTKPVQYSPVMRTSLEQTMRWTKPEPAVRIVDPVLRNANPDVRSSDTTARFGVPVARSVEPGAGAVVARSMDPDVHTEDPGAQTADLGVPTMDTGAIGQDPLCSIEPGFEGSSSSGIVGSDVTVKQEISVSHGSVELSPTSSG